MIICNAFVANDVYRLEEQLNIWLRTMQQTNDRFKIEKVVQSSIAFNNFGETKIEIHLTVIASF